MLFNNRHKAILQVVAHILPFSLLMLPNIITVSIAIILSLSVSCSLSFAFLLSVLFSSHAAVNDKPQCHDGRLVHVFMSSY